MDYDKWDDISDEEADARIAIAKNRRKANSCDTSQLSEQEQLSLRPYKLGIERDLANDELTSPLHCTSVPRRTQVPSFLINIHSVKSIDAKAYIGRLDNVRTYFDQVIEQMKVAKKLAYSRMGLR